MYCCARQALQAPNSQSLYTTNLGKCDYVIVIAMLMHAVLPASAYSDDADIISACNNARAYRHGWLCTTCVLNAATALQHACVLNAHAGMSDTPQPQVQGVRKTSAFERSTAVTVDNHKHHGDWYSVSDASVTNQCEYLMCIASYVKNHSIASSITAFVMACIQRTGRRLLELTSWLVSIAIHMLCLSLFNSSMYAMRMLRFTVN